MQRKPVSLITGDGIGPEISKATKRIIEKSSAQLDWEVIEADPQQENGERILNRMIESIKRTGVGLKAPITTPIGTGYSSITVALRQELELFANVRPAKQLANLGPDLHSSEVDLVTIRENTEGLYSGIEHNVKDQFAESVKLTTREGSERIGRFAFEYATTKNRGKVTAVHKANILKETDGLFLDCCRSVSRDFPGVELEEMIVDNMAMQLILRPDDFEILLTPNLYGDILSDLSAGLIGGLGVAPGGNFGKDRVVFEAVHGSAPDIAGKNLANPLGLLRSGLMMLEYLGEIEAGNRIESAVNQVLEKGDVLTADLGGDASTTTFTEEIISRL